MRVGKLLKVAQTLPANVVFPVVLRAYKDSLDLIFIRVKSVIISCAYVKCCLRLGASLGFPRECNSVECFILTQKYNKQLVALMRYSHSIAKNNAESQLRNS